MIQAPRQTRPFKGDICRRKAVETGNNSDRFNSVTNSMKTFLITGGAGFIGTNLVKYLVGEGYAVIVVDDLSAGDAMRLPPEVTFHQFDIRDTQTLAAMCVGVDIVVHLAAFPQTQFSIDEPVISHDINVNGTLSVLEAVRQAGVKRVVYAASAGVYGDQLVTRLTTDLRVHPKTPYALHKYIGEEYMRLWSELFGIETVSLRFFNVYGPHLDPDGAYALVIGRFLKQVAMHEALTITGDGEQTRDFIHVCDIARAIEKAALSDAVGKGDVLNIGSGVQTTINEVARLISSNITYVPARIEIRSTEADIDETVKLLNWQPTIALVEGLADLKKEFGL